ncbi:MAG: Flp pilus assembly complex ATPase component TadA [Candidatus Riflebacteria bacterium]|nr:Flp pilus assembly complex ATPase component TadA [Candidatus Riflebacteria bacterium]
MRSKTKWILFNLDSAIDQERLQAIIQAAECDDPVILQTLASIARSDPSMEHRHMARRSIAQIRDRLSKGGVTAGDGSSILEMPRIHEFLSSKDPAVRVKAIQALAAFEHPEKEKVLRHLVTREKDPFVRSELVKSLVVLGADGISLIVEFLQDQDVRVKVGAIEALQGLGTAEAYTHIVPFLLDTEHKTREAATAALNRFGKAGLLQVLSRMIGDSRAPYRDAAVHALALVRLPETLPLLKKALDDSVSGVRDKAAEGLELLAQAGLAEADTALEEYRSKQQPVAETPSPGTVSATIERGEMLEPISTANMLEDFDPENRIAEIRRIIRMKAYERAAELAARCKVEKDKNVLSCLLLALGRLKAREYIPLLKKHLRSDNDRIRANVVEGLGLMEDRSVHVDLLPYLQDPHNRVKVNAILALIGHPGHDPHARLAECLHHPEQAVRRSALYGLLELRDGPAVALFEKALSDNDPVVRETAMEFLAILKSEGIDQARTLYEQAHAQGLRPPGSTSTFTRTGRGARLPKYSLDELLYYLKEVGGSDLHLNVGIEPCIRLHGEMRRVRSLPLTADDTKRMMYAVLNEDQIVKLEKNYSLDFSYSIAGVARFRVNTFREVRGYKGVFRLVPMDLPTLDGLQVPPIFKRFCQLKQGLLLMTGPTGMGKSTTLAAMINEINNTGQKHIITIEDPIEFMHPHRMSVVSKPSTQWPLVHCASRSHTCPSARSGWQPAGSPAQYSSAGQSVSPEHGPRQAVASRHAPLGQGVAAPLVQPPVASHVGAGVSMPATHCGSPQIVPAASGEGRVLALEIMVNTPAISNLIREGKSEQIYTVIQVSHEAGMMTLDAHLAQLVALGRVTKNVALEYAMDKKSFLASVK